MNARIDQANQPDPGLERDARLEKQIDAAYARMVDPKASLQESNAAWTEMAVLIGRRSQNQIMRMEFEMRLLRKAAKS